VQILEDITKWMAKEGYLKGAHQLDGLVLLHPITMHRLGGNERRRTRLLQDLLGQDAYKRIIIATTMWERINDANNVEIGLEGRKKDIWHDLVSKGAVIRRHNNSPDSAHRIIREIVKLSNDHGKLVPLIQKELARDSRIVKTTAGKSVKRELEASIERVKVLLEEHDQAKPEEWRAGNKHEHRKKKKELEKRLERLEAKLVKLSSLQVGCRS